MTNPTPLSPAAQAVVAAIEKFDWESGHFSREEIWALSKEVTAAALRAAAANYRSKVSYALPNKFVNGVLTVANALDEIADELEGAQ